MQGEKMMTEKNEMDIETQGETEEEKAKTEGLDATGEGIEQKPEEVNELDTLREELEEAKAQADEYLEGWQRARAELSNYRKRQETERVRLREMANATLLRNLLPVIDDLDRALTTMPTALNLLSWSEGIFLIQRKLEAILNLENVEPIETTGQMFDPRYHEAVTHEESPDHEEGEIIGEVQKGYMLGERVLRPALVRVAKAPVAPEPEEEEAQSPPE